MFCDGSLTSQVGGGDGTEDLSGANEPAGSAVVGVRKEQGGQPVESHHTVRLVVLEVISEVDACPVSEIRPTQGGQHVVVLNLPSNAVGFVPRRPAVPPG